MSFDFAAGGWWTGHYQYFDDIVITQEAAANPSATPTSTLTATTTRTPSKTPTPTYTRTPTPIATSTPTQIPANTTIVTPTFTPTRTGTATPLDLVADKLEVVQSIQDLNNSVPLIVNKRTFVRFHVHSTSGEYSATARLHVQSGSQSVDLVPQNPGGLITVRPDPNRAVLDHAFLFALPSGFESGTVQLTAEVNANGDPVETNLVNNSAEATVMFEDVPQQNLVLYSVGYGPEHQPSYPPDIDRTRRCGCSGLSR